MTDKFDSFPDLLRHALAGRLPASDDMLDLFAEDLVFEFPYAPAGLPQRLVGRQALADHMASLGPLIAFGSLCLDAVHRAGDTFVIEFRCCGHGRQTGRPYDQSYISVITLRNGRIARYRDYWNPDVVTSALGGAEAAARAFTRNPGDG